MLSCIFCGVGQDCIRHYIYECSKVKDTFEDLGADVEERWSRIWDDEIDNEKGKVLKNLWKEREKLQKVNMEKRNVTSCDRM